MEYDLLIINNYVIRVRKRIKHVFKDKGNITEKIIYTVPLNLELYKQLPEVVQIKDKEFYKTDINEINQTHFKLIEI